MAVSTSKGKTQSGAAAQKLRRRLKRLKAVAEAGFLVNSTLDLEHIAKHIVEIAARLIHAERGTLFLLQKDGKSLLPIVAQGVSVQTLRVKMGQGITGRVAETSRPILLNDAYTDKRFDPEFDRKTGLKTRSLLTVPIRNNQEGLVGVLQLVNHRKDHFTREDIKFLSELAVPFAIALTSAKLHSEIVAQEKTKQELRLAADIQRTLLPRDLSVVPGLELQAEFQPCFEVAGDYYDLIPTQRGSWWLVLGDVSGKGVASAMIASNIQAFLWSRRKDDKHLSEIASEANELLCTLARGRKYITMILAEWRPGRKHLTWVNAGHPPMLLRSSGRVRRLAATGVPLGLLSGQCYSQDEAVLSGSDQFLMVSDGVTEAGEISRGEEFGLDRVVQCLKQDLSCEDLANDLARKVSLFRRGAPAQDDLTILCGRCIESPATRKT
ncbi:MAG: SpoIIE family protein phosphatase [Acidobacteriota bacterium]